MPTLLEAPDFVGHSIFADDLRMEVDGKLTYVGAYRSRMYVNGTFPFTLPKFAIDVYFSQRKDLFVPNLRILVLLPGDPDDKPSVQAELTEVSEGAATEKLSQDQLPDSHYIMLSAGMVLSPLIIKQTGTISVRVLRNDELHRCGSLSVLQGTIPPT